ncbi:hypothetical protein BV25DRAFT_1992574 [Artomyces pyxidatus]|uniref:Uncharacterized protein n=1 Tax=Artomyces pyxidatus TaxID=48021 RepID=A0ACB8SXZ0_9AGAM|nr:hypothetical protein BV25DRAFT_1992574 [Artomyces pyxidatus]
MSTREPLNINDLTGAVDEPTKDDGCESVKARSAFDVLDEEIAAAKLVIILCIFAFLAHEHLPEVPQSRRRRIRDKLGWINVTHVCRRWREIALSTPRLWIVVDFSLGPSWLKEVLARSKHLPIALDNNSSPIPYKAANIISCNIFRATSMVLRDLEDDSDGCSSIYDISLSRPAPLLQNLSLHSVPSFALPFKLFGNHAPQLRRLSLTNCWALPWTSNIWKQLVHLDLTFLNPTNPDEDTPLLEDFLCLLETTTALETLKLHQFVPCVDASEDIQIVNLPHLRLFIVNGDAAQCASFIVRLRIPPTARLRITSSTDGGYREFDPLLSSLSEYVSPRTRTADFVPRLDLTSSESTIPPNQEPSLDPQVLPFTQMKFSRNIHVEDAKFVAAAWSGFPFASPAGNMWFSGDTPDVILTFRWQSLTVDEYESDVQCVHHLTHATPAYVWRGIFGSSYEVRAVTCDGSSCSSLCDALSVPLSPLEEPLPGRPPQVVFPKLSELHLQSVAPGFMHRWWRPLLPMLSEMVEFRRQYATPVDTLTLKECAITKASVDALEEMVRVVDWDGEEVAEPFGYRETTP